MATNKKIQKVKPQQKAKAAPKASVKASKKPATPLKSVKKPVAKAAKPVAKKPAASTKSTKQKQPVKAVAKPKIVAAKAKPAVAPAPKAAPAIQVKAPINQNAKPAVILQKTSEGLKPLSPNSLVKPVYRPIQVINKSLAPLQPVRQMAPVAPAAEKIEYKKGDYVVYPAHGVGQIEAVETQTISGMQIKLYAIVFEKDRMRLKVPVFKAHAAGLRRLSSSNRMQDALKTLQGRAQIRRAMWSRRAQEYEMKINSGDPVAIAEVLRDLKRSNDDTEQSYSERQIYQSALERLAREVAVVEKITELEAAERLENMIKGRRARSAGADKDKAEAPASAKIEKKAVAAA
jgi:CarD family transcriptional regulator